MALVQPQMINENSFTPTFPGSSQHICIWHLRQQVESLLNQELCDEKEQMSLLGTTDYKNHCLDPETYSARHLAILEDLQKSVPLPI